MAKHTVTFRTDVQAAIFENELQGQISDGQWENTVPHSHWEVWCKAKIQVGENVGRNFYAMRDNYNFLNKDLLECVGNRMISYAKLCIAFGRDKVQELDNFLDMSGDFRGIPTHEGAYWDDIRAKAVNYDLVALKAALEADTYTMADLRADLKEMKAAIRIQRN